VLPRVYYKRVVCRRPGSMEASQPTPYPVVLNDDKTCIVRAPPGSLPFSDLVILGHQSQPHRVYNGHPDATGCYVFSLEAALAPAVQTAGRLFYFATATHQRSRLFQMINWATYVLAPPMPTIPSECAPARTCMYVTAPADIRSYTHIQITHALHPLAVFHVALPDEIQPGELVALPSHVLLNDVYVDAHRANIWTGQTLRFVDAYTHHCSAEFVLRGADAAHVGQHTPSKHTGAASTAIMPRAITFEEDPIVQIMHDAAATESFYCEAPTDFDCLFSAFTSSNE
jgi:hypothetical protein